MASRKRAQVGTGRATAATNIVRRRTRKENYVEEPHELGNPIGRFVFNELDTDPFRVDHYIHASDLIYKCMRAVALAGDLEIPVPTDGNWQSMKLVHAMGHACAAYITEKVLSRSDSVFGYWKCVCGSTRLGPHTRAECNHYCEDCNQPVNVYDELTLYNEEYRIVGNCDLAFMENGYLILSELKSISKRQFDDLTGAKPDHQLQLLLYYWMAVQAGYKVHPDLAVFYSCREWMIGNPFKEFLLDADSAERRVRPLLQEAASIREWRDGGPIPARDLCISPDVPRAKKCALCTECFLRPSRASS